jgi:hypothetical protein
MKVKCEWMVVAERIIDDANTGTISLIACLEQISVYSFPYNQPGFGIAASFRCIGDPPESPMPLQFRIVRLSEYSDPETVFEADSTWAAGLSRARLAVSFQFLRLLRPETLSFRVEHRFGTGRWVQGNTCSLDVVQLKLSPEQELALRNELQAKGMAAPSSSSAS